MKRFKKIVKARDLSPYRLSLQYKIAYSTAYRILTYLDYEPGVETLNRLEKISNALEKRA